MMFLPLFKRKKVRVRFAPSPTGPLHIGAARTALFNFLFAAANRGKFILRIEDTDLERSDKKFEIEIIETLKWLGLNWDEGPHRQSERLPIYNSYVKKLLLSGDAFYCFHSLSYLEKEYEDQLKVKQNPAHRCEFRKLAKEDAEKRLKREGAIVRFKTPMDQEINFSDLIRGPISFNSDTLGGDFSLAKAKTPDEFLPLYNFAVVIDDADMKITHVIRGEDHISNTPKQILIQKALDFPTPEYAHLPLILGPDKSKLSKRHGAVSVSEYLDDGYLPEALINFMALLGWNPKTDKEIFSLAELVEEFDLAKIQKSGAVWSLEKLDWLNGNYIRGLPLDNLTRRLAPFLIKAGLIGERYDFERLKAIVALERPRLKKLGEAAERLGFFFKKPEFKPELLIWRDMLFKDVLKSLETSREVLSGIPEPDFKKENLEKILLEQAQKAKKGDRGRLLWPLRAALSGLEASPGPFEILEILGKDESISRIDNAVKKLE